jgi:rhamnose utilization protein RhaD (predicted bifunctional aldolase and dehydrogenase)
MLALPQDSEFRGFVALSARLGADPLLVQAAGGNTSIKRDGALWIKASGKELRAAQADTIFVPVDLAGVRAGIERDEADPTAGRVQGDTALRPSIETTLHALLPQRVVLHLHSVNALAWEVRSDGEARVAERLAGLPWAWVPYHRPGLPLTRACGRRRAGVAVLALANHGIVVGADDCIAGEALVRARSSGASRLRRGRRPPRRRGSWISRTPRGTARRPTRSCTRWRPTRRASLGRGRACSPDHVVFLGGGPSSTTSPRCPAPSRPHRARQRRRARRPARPGRACSSPRVLPRRRKRMLRCQAEVLLPPARGPRSAAYRPPPSASC